jgi:hypothetical protein
LLADKLLDAANLALAGLFFAQFVTGTSFSVWLAVLGLATWTAFLGLGVLLAGGRR